MAEKMKSYDSPNIFVRFGRGFVNFFTHGIPNFFTKKIPAFFKKLGHGFVNFFSTFGKRFVDGSIGTKLSHFIFGAGNLYHGQIIKGLIYLILQVLFVLYMVLCPGIVGPNNVIHPTGYKSLINLSLPYFTESISGRWTPNTEINTPNSFLMLLLGLVTIAIIILYIILWLSNIKSSYLADTAVKEGRKPSSFKEDVKALFDNRFHIMMLTPTCIAALAFSLLPTILMISLAFTTYNDFDMTAAGTTLFHWNGMSNFVAIFTMDTTSSLGVEIGARFLPVLGWTMLWAVLATFTCYFGGILLAVLINKKGLKFKKVFRTIFILTIAIPQFISLLIMRNLLMGTGPINSLLISWGWIKEPISFLGQNVGDNPWIARLMVVIINMWLGIPYTMLMTSGILMNIPADLYEAAPVVSRCSSRSLFHTSSLLPLHISSRVLWATSIHSIPSSY